jgi:hypothetical protein|tara:strand:- start:1532 stop:1912 length:381 start_codon:yes stop_codon:yes gene_type:complete
MGSNLWMYVTFLWVTTTLLGGILEMQYSSTAENQSAINQLIQLKVFEFKELKVLMITIPAPLPNTEFFSGLTQLLTWDFEFLKGNYNIFRWFWLVITAGMSFVLVTRVGPVILEVVATLRSFLPRF